ncbi:MAG: ABC transporter substrate binding protein, partial [Sphingomonadaceae bacterium]
MTLRVPYMPDDAIERDAEALLAQYAHIRGVEIKAPIPIEDIVEKHLKLRVEFDDLHRLLGVPRSGLGLDPDIFGAIWLDTGKIVIDESLDPEERPAMEGRYRFTLAHEGGGHWRLHRGFVRSDRDQEIMFTDVPKPAVVCRSSQAKERVEWQADFYASCLLMPGSNIAIEVRWADGRYERLPALVAELIGLKVDIIVVAATPGSLAVKSATNTIPVVIVAVSDPTRIGLVASLVRPGGNITGLSLLTPELSGKRLQLLVEIAPK